MTKRSRRRPPALRQSLAALLAFGQLTAAPALAQDMIMQDFVTPQIGPQGEVDRLENKRLQRRGEPRTPTSPRASIAPKLRQMEAEYKRRYRANGKTSADAWAAEQGRRDRQRLAAHGKCTLQETAGTRG